MAKRRQRLVTSIGLYYPADELTLKKIKAAGGLSKIPDEDRRGLRYKEVKAGGFCDDHPKGLQLDNLLERGTVKKVFVEVDDSTPIERVSEPPRSIDGGTV